MQNSLVKMSDLIDPAITAVGQEEINCKYLPALPSTGSDYLELSFFKRQRRLSSWFCLS